MSAKDKEDFAAYKRWEKYILGTHPELPKGIRRPNLIAYCLAMAIKGFNGLDCYASDETIGKEIGIANRSVVAKYRKLAIELGWFAWNGKRKGRAKVLDIAIPADAKPADTESPAEPKHDAWIDSKDDDLRYCLACEPLLGSHSIDELWEIHAEALRQSNVPLG